MPEKTNLIPVLTLWRLKLQKFNKTRYLSYRIPYHVSSYTKLYNATSHVICMWQNNIVGSYQYIIHDK